MICPHCGLSSEGGNFCPHCGLPSEEYIPLQPLVPLRVQDQTTALSKEQTHFIVSKSKVQNGVLFVSIGLIVAAFLLIVLYLILSV